MQRLGNFNSLLYKSLEDNEIIGYYDSIKHEYHFNTHTVEVSISERLLALLPGNVIDGLLCI